VLFRSMSGVSESKLILITGATNGIGLRTAEVLLSLNHKVIIASRNLSKVEQTVSLLSSQFPKCTVVGFALDLSSMASVDEFSKQVSEKFPIIDVMILNAGVISMSSKMELSAEGVESVFATNHLGHYYLVEKLLPLSHPTRIVVVSSGTHDPDSGSGTAPPDPIVSNWPSPPTFDGNVAYTSSKLANAMYGNYLARRFQSSAITVAVYDPGFIGDTGLLRGLGYCQPVAKFAIECLIGVIAWYKGVRNQNSSLERSSPYLARLAVDPALTQVSGKYYSIDSEQHCSLDALNVRKQEELIDMSKAILIEKGFLR